MPSRAGAAVLDKIPTTPTWGKLAHQGASTGGVPIDGAGCGACVRFRRSHAGGSETRPAGHDAGLPGAGCPGRGSVVRDHEARDRTEPRPRGFGKSRDGAPKGERAPHSGWFAVTRIVRGARRTGRGFGCSHPKRRCGSRTRRLPALRLPLFIWRQSFRAVAWQNSGAKERVARTMSLTLPCRGGSRPKGAGWGARQKRLRKR